MASVQGCREDLDCPGAQMCYANMSWTQGNSFCDCYGWYGRYGRDCDEPTPYFFVMIGIAVGFVVWGAALTGRAARDVRVVNTRLGGVAASPTNLSSAFACATLASFTAWKFCYLLEFLIPMRGPFLLIRPENHVKRSVIADWTGLVMAFLVAFIVLGFLVVSLSWLEGSRVAVHLSARAVAKMRIYRGVCLVVGTFFSGLTLVVVFMRRSWFVIIIAMASAALMAILFMFGYFGMESLRRKTPAAEGTALRERLKRLLRNIRRCCLHTVLWIVALLISGTLWFVLFYAVSENGVLGMSRPGVGCWAMLSYELVALCVLNLGRTQHIYCHENIQARAEALDRLSSSSTKPSSNDSQPEPGMLTPAAAAHPSLEFCSVTGVV